MNIQLYS